MKALCKFLCVLIPICNSMASAQELSTSIERSIREKEPDWQLVAKESEPAYTIYRWKMDKQYVNAEVHVTASNQAAADLFHEFGMRIPVPPKSKPNDLGDEALLFQSANAPNGSLLFRKANVFIAISGSSMIDEVRFARHLAGLISTK
jgi:hypothetical protein